MYCLYCIYHLMTFQQIQQYLKRFFKEKLTKNVNSSARTKIVKTHFRNIVPRFRGENKLSLGSFYEYG